MPFIVVGWTSHMNGYCPAASAGTLYVLWPGPLKNAVSPMSTFEPSSFVRTVVGHAGVLVVERP
jgi:hypothetical protein